MSEETIFAVATAPGKAGVSVIRISGPDAHAAAETLAGALPPPRLAGLRRLRDAKGDVLDEALVLRFQAGQSFTGEDVVEFHCHGSIAVVRRVLTCLGDLPGCRSAEPGEFTRRAMENGRLDLTQVEALADLIEAETEVQRRQAQRALSGALGARVASWRVDLVRAAALLEAVIDFADEEVPEDVSVEVLELLGRVRDGLSTELSGMGAAERVREGFEVAIVGAPNVGKSTLLNRLAGREAAITSDIAGTTRDVIEVRMDVHGLPVTFLDTAGIREARDAVEEIGISRARDRASAADLRVFLVSAKEDVEGIAPQSEDIILNAKADLSGASGGVSGLTGAGVEDLLRRVADVLGARVNQSGLATRERHRDAMIGAEQSLEAAVALVTRGPEAYDIGAEETRASIRTLEALVGRIDVEVLLDEIFASFCLGK
ncbi:tRNA uridine-5-carboxymethylaminomethyl(34) synthesis GTPase MnmE [Rhodosalinus sp. FB01]|uniref:tRNA uridine-5-carboxymethylaminomethyl(34) synthesis GTPase MnmE n=1 Tax=Rhodosalinus sp. FB01 TaxID=3239194 RepID=UPI0035255EFA